MMISFWCPLNDFKRNMFDNASSTRDISDSGDSDETGHVTTWFGTIILRGFFVKYAEIGIAAVLGFLLLLLDLVSFEVVLLFLFLSIFLVHEGGSQHSFSPDRS